MFDSEFNNAWLKTRMEDWFPPGDFASRREELNAVPFIELQNVKGAGALKARVGPWRGWFVLCMFLFKLTFVRESFSSPRQLHRGTVCV